MKIAHLTWSLGTGGIETMLIDITNEQIISNQVAIYVINDNLDRDIVNRINKKCIFICCSRKIGSKNILPILRLNYELYKFNPDIIHIHLPGIIKLIPFIRSKKVFTIHNTHTDNKEYSKFDSLFAISDAVKMHTLQQGYNAITIYNGIDTNAVSYNKELKDTSVFKIIQIGRLYTPHKGQHILLKAINLLVHNRGFYNISVDFIGEGPSFEELYEYVVSHKLQDFVSFIGLKSREYIYRNLCEYDLCVQPSLSEGFGLTIVESMLAKVPVLVSIVSNANCNLPVE